MPPRTRAAAAAEAVDVRVISYNVLSSALGIEKSYPLYDPEHISPPNRLRLVIAEIRSCLLLGSLGPKTIVCLQEVSGEWAPALVQELARHGFSAYVTHYDWAHSSNMGVLIAWNPAVFCATKLIKKQIANLLPRMAASEAAPPSLLSKLTAWVWRPEHQEHWWDTCRRKYNEAIFAHFQCNTSGQEFCVATYHAPCMYTNEAAMLVNTGAFIKWAQSLSEHFPLIVAGDLNIKPGDPAYTAITQCTVPYDIEMAIPELSQPLWQPVPDFPMHSAYFDSQLAANPTSDAPVREPVTTHACMGNNTPFMDTLDYVFYRGDCIELVGTVELPDISAALLPDATRGSDHLLIGASFKFL